MEFIKRFFRSFVLNKKYNPETQIWEYGFWHQHIFEGFPYCIPAGKKWLEWWDYSEYRWHCHNLYPMQKFINWYLKILS